MSKIENMMDEDAWEELLEQIAPDRAKGYAETQRRIEQMEESLNGSLYKRLKREINEYNERG